MFKEALLMMVNQLVDKSSPQLTLFRANNAQKVVFQKRKDQPGQSENSGSGKGTGWEDGGGPTLTLPLVRPCNVVGLSPPGVQQA